MKNPIHAIKEAINARHELAITRSWAAYLEGEIKALNKKLCRDNISINELVRENEIISGANTRLLKELAAVRHLVGKELELVHTCMSIHSSGKVIKKRTFNHAVGAVLRARNGVRNAACADVWRCQNSGKSGKATEAAPATK
ncbi:hypothetical protein ACQVA2_13700 [Citrobacter sp. OP27]